MLKSELFHIDGKQLICMASKGKVTGLISNIFITIVGISQHIGRVGISRGISAFGFCFVLNYI